MDFSEEKEDGVAPELPIAEASLLFQALEHGKWRVSAHRQPRTNGFEGLVGWIFFWSGPVRHSLRVHTVEKGPTMCHSEASKVPLKKASIIIAHIRCRGGVLVLAGRQSFADLPTCGC